MKRLIQNIILLLTIGLMVYYITNNYESFKNNILSINPIYFPVILVLFFLGTITGGLIIKYLLQPFNIKLKIKEWFGLTIITSFYNMITPFRGGLMAKAAYLKKKHNFSFSHFVSAMSGIYIVNFLVASLLGLISIYIIYTQKHIFNLLIFLAFLAIFTVSLLIILISPKIKSNKNKLLNSFVNVINGWHTIKKSKKIVFISAMVMTMQLLLSTIATLLVYSTIGVNLNYFESLFICSIGLIVSFFSITPGGLGVTEAVAVFSALIIGITPDQSLTVAIIQRALSTIYIFILGPIFVYKLLKK